MNKIEKLINELNYLESLMRKRKKLNNIDNIIKDYLDKCSCNDYNFFINEDRQIAVRYNTFNFKEVRKITDHIALLNIRANE